KDGNASPMFPLLECPLTLVAPLPTPALAEPRSVFNAQGQPCMELKWFCPPPGVERFKVYLEEEGSRWALEWFRPMPAALAAHTRTILAQPVEPSFGPLLREIPFEGRLSQTVASARYASEYLSRGAATRQFYTPRVGP